MALLLLVPVAFADSPKTEPYIFVDLDGDGIDDNMLDTDDDGIPDALRDDKNETPAAAPVMKAATVNPFAGLQQADPVVFPKPNSERFVLRRLWARSLSQYRCDFDSEFSSGTGASSSGASGGGCAGGVCGR
ncbi:MAG: hypothetical protein KKA42_12120 [candidate division Zixibacteria bacterium]|nr:hypothetical protein [candidate division Zixibacteria bacterium]